MAAPFARRLLGLAVALALMPLLYAAWRLAAPAAWLRALLVGTVALASLRPRDALLVLAGLGPIVGVYGTVAGAPYSVRELLILATFAGWALRLASARRAEPLIPPDLRWPLTAATLVIICSVAVEAFGHRELVGPAAFGVTLGHTAEHGLLRDRHGVRGLDAGFIYIEGLAMFAAASALCSRRPAFGRQAAAMAVAGAAGAALLNIQRLIVSALASPAPLDRLRELVATTRVNVSYLDVNAAGSYFALMFFPASALGLRGSGPARAGWGAAAMVIFAAAWLTGSRAAVAAILTAAALATVVVARRRAWHKGTFLAALLCALLAAAAFVALFPNRVFGAATPIAVEIRLQMARISLGLLAQHPWFGVGVGGFYEASAPLLEASTISAYYPRENAHNNVLQMLAELGIIGFAAFAWLLGAAARRVAVAVQGAHGHLAGGLAAGLLAFAFTAMLGHPLLTPEVSHAFWLLLGVGAGIAPLPADGRAPRAARPAALLLLVLVVGLLPWRFRGEAASLPLEHVRYGVSQWETDPEGVRYQTFTGEATLFVPSAARAVDIPLRLHQGDTPVVVEIRFRNRVADRITVTSSGWQTYRLMIGGRQDRLYLPVGMRVLTDERAEVSIGRTVVR